MGFLNIQAMGFLESPWFSRVIVERHVCGHDVCSAAAALRSRLHASVAPHTGWNGSVVLQPLVVLPPFNFSHHQLLPSLSPRSLLVRQQQLLESDRGGGIQVSILH